MMMLRARLPVPYVFAIAQIYGSDLSQVIIICIRLCHMGRQ